MEQVLREAHEVPLFNGIDAQQLAAFQNLLAAHGMKGVLEDTHLAQGRAAAAQVAQMRVERTSTLFIDGSLSTTSLQPLT